MPSGFATFVRDKWQTVADNTGGSNKNLDNYNKIIGGWCQGVGGMCVPFDGGSGSPISPHTSMNHVCVGSFLAGSCNNYPNLNGWYAPTVAYAKWNRFVTFGGAGMTGANPSVTDIKNAMDAKPTIGDYIFNGVDFDLEGCLAGKQANLVTNAVTVKTSANQYEGMKIQLTTNGNYSSSQVPNWAKTQGNMDNVDYIALMCYGRGMNTDDWGINPSCANATSPTSAIPFDCCPTWGYIKGWFSDTNIMKNPSKILLAMTAFPGGGLEAYMVTYFKNIATHYGLGGILFWDVRNATKWINQIKPPPPPGPTPAPTPAPSTLCNLENSSKENCYSCTGVGCDKQGGACCAENGSCGGLNRAQCAVMAPDTCWCTPQPGPAPGPGPGPAPGPEPGPTPAPGPEPGPTPAPGPACPIEYNMGKKNCTKWCDEFGYSCRYLENAYSFNCHDCPRCNSIGWKQGATCSPGTTPPQPAPGPEPGPAPGPEPGPAPGPEPGPAPGPEPGPTPAPGPACPIEYNMGKKNCTKWCDEFGYSCRYLENAYSFNCHDCPRCNSIGWKQGATCSPGTTPPTAPTL